MADNAIFFYAIFFFAQFDMTWPTNTTLAAHRHPRYSGDADRVCEPSEGLGREENYDCQYPRFQGGPVRNSLNINLKHKSKKLVL